MHSLKILPLSPPSPRCPAIVVRHIRLWFLATPPAVPILVLQPRIPRRLSVLRCLAPPQPPHPALSRRHRRPRTLRAVIVVLVLWLVRETFSGLLLG